MTDFGTWLATYMDNQRPPIGRPELARRSGIDVRTIGRWINNEIRPTPDKLRQLAPVLGIDYAELLTAAGYGAPADTPPKAVAPRRIHPLAAELDRMLDPGSPLGDDDRQALELGVNLVMESKRRMMRRRRSA